MFTDKTFYTGKIFIPNLNESCNGLSFHEWVEQYEEECLRIILGDCLYHELIEQMVFDEVSQSYILNPIADEKWDWLVNGHVYSKDDIQNQSLNFHNYLGCGCGCTELNCDDYRWDGLVKVLDRRIQETTIDNVVVNGLVRKTSLLADYVYYQWSVNSETTTTGTGEQILKVKGATRVSNKRKRVTAYNSFVSSVIDCNSHGKVGLYRFIQDFNELFPEWQGQNLCYESIW